MTDIIERITLVLSIILMLFTAVHAQKGEDNDGTKGVESERPANVVVSDISTGMVSPEAEFIGTVYYQEVSDVASEVSGMVEVVNFEEGQRIKEGDILVRIDSDLLEKTLNATTASYEQVLADLEKAEKDLRRTESLYREELISEKLYDANRFNVKGLEKKANSLRSDVERLEVELQKKKVKAPFDGVAIKKHVDRGEWLSPGATVATVAKDDIVDIIVEVPERVIKATKTGMSVKVKAGGKEMTGKVFAVIPRGDIATRTFPVKIRITNSMLLIEGMEARVALPEAKKRKTLIVPRDAVVTMYGNTVVFAVKDSTASLIQVNVIGYKGKTAGINGQGLTEGMKVVIKGNERLRNGQKVNILNHR